MIDEIIKDKEYTLIEIIKETPDVNLYKFKANDNTKLNFDPGMFVMIKYKDNEQEISRAFSIASEPNSETLDFYIHLINGRFTTKMANAKINDIFYISGPHGQFKFIPKNKKQLLFIAGGTGIAPFISMIRYIKTLNLDINIVMFYSVRVSNGIIAKNELEELSKQINLKQIICITREDPSWNGEKGHITKETIEKHIKDADQRTVYICGPLQFTKAMEEVAIECNVKKENINADIWG